MVTGDFDGDGSTDLYAVQNSFAPIPSVGRFDGGLSVLLRGDGQGNFMAMPFAESGLIVAGDAKGLAMLDLNDDGWADFIVTRNSATSLVFQNAGRSNGNALAVALEGPAGNHNAIGARLRLALKDGTFQVADVTAGSGYMSQSSPSSFFGYRTGNEPREVKVTWPDGTITSHPVPDAVGKMLIKRE